MKWFVSALYYQYFHFFEKWKFVNSEDFAINTILIGWATIQGFATLILLYRTEILELYSGLWIITLISWTIAYLFGFRPALKGDRDAEIIKDNRYDTTLCKTLAILWIGVPILFIATLSYTISYIFGPPKHMLALS